jgi:hypothetical protein
VSTDPTTASTAATAAAAAEAGGVAIPPSPAERRRVKRPVPGWASVAVLSACLLGGAWLLWWFVAGSAPRERTVTLKEVPRMARRGGGGGGGGPNPIGNMFRQIAQTTYGVIVVKPGEWRVRAPGDAVMRVVKHAEGRFDYTFYYDRNDLVTPDELKLLMFRAQVVADADAARAAEITPQQMATFKKLQSQTGMAIGPAARDELIGLWETYVLADAASKPAAEKPLVARLEALGKQNLAATKQQMSGRAALVKSVLTPAQRQRVR